MSVNKVILVGNLGKDPEVRYLDNGTPVCRFSVATNETYKNKAGEKVTNTEWHNVVLWRGLAEVAEKFLKKGNMVYVEGKLQTRAWDDKDGNKRYTTEIIGTEMTMLGRKDGSGGLDSTPFPSEEPEGVRAGSSRPEPDKVPDNFDESDDLPF
ncbi:MAG: single-stranded DNA-binding protein [Bacteroidales bacterium]|nr:single-stranded DNA-binding protein [Bacteroidales bacterium]